jgi:succinate dehydrogenase / fumarate reductase cytochrome b subunit
VTYATRTTRYGGVIIALFLVWHLLDLSVGVANPDFDAGSPYHNVVVDFRVWWINVIYIVAVAMVGMHIQHGFASAAQSLGVRTAGTERAIRIAGTALAIAITVGFVSVPIGVMTGLVR